MKATVEIEIEVEHEGWEVASVLVRVELRVNGDTLLDWGAPEVLGSRWDPDTKEYKEKWLPAPQWVVESVDATISRRRDTFYQLAIESRHAL